MVILHLSDTHGSFPPLRDVESADVIVHSGDLMPNRSFGIRPIEESFQRYWLEDNAERFRAWLPANKPVLLCPGNHDYVYPVEYLRDLGIDARWLADTFLEIDEVGFYGFPWTPTFYDWNWMCGPDEMQGRLQPAVELMDQGAIDVFVSHGPLAGVLDLNDTGTSCGSEAVRDALLGARHRPKLMLHGHIHESCGVAQCGGMTVSNAATTQRLLSL